MTESAHRIKIAIQKSGRLSDESLRLLKQTGLQFESSKDKLFWYGRNLPVDLLLVRDDDIPRLLLEGV
ncbi:MAG: ATP phosphoribosyltransferase, partial [Wenzhouxiangellaceae bacterium]